MKRLFTVEDISKVIDKEGCINLFFYRNSCKYSVVLFKQFIKNKHIKVYVLSYKIMSNLALQFGVEVIPSILCLDKNGITHLYSGSGKVKEFIIKKELEYEECEETKDKFEEKSTQTGEKSDSSDSEIDITYQILSPYVIRDNVEAIETNQ